jgi:ABC-2 type transport system permease protein
MNPVTRWTLRMRKVSTAWWAFGIAAFITLTLAFYPSIKSQSAQLDKSFDQLSGSTKSFITDTNDLFSPVGYLSSQIFYLLLPILFSILLIGVGSSLVAREEQSGTIEFLLARPISRTRLLLGKAWSGLLIGLAVAGVALISVVILCKIVDINVGSWNIVGAVLMSFMLALIFGSFAFMLTCLGGAIRGLSIGLTSGLLLISYLLSSLEKSVHWLHWPSQFLPYHYFEPANILNGHFTWGALLGFAGVTVAFLLISIRGFAHRDIG